MRSASGAESSLFRSVVKVGWLDKTLSPHTQISDVRRKQEKQKAEILGPEILLPTIIIKGLWPHELQSKFSP
jgi:hypothetical protein